MKANWAIHRKIIHFISIATAAGTLAILTLAVLTPAQAAEEFPSKPITVVIHAKYGGGTDTTARLMMIRARRGLGVDMQVVAKRGGSGAKAHQFAAGRPRDGYTILALTQSHLYTIARGKSVLSINDVVGIARAMDDPTFIVVSGKSGIKSLKELVARSRRKPLNWGVAEIAGTEHIGLVQFAKAAGFRFKVVPFGSGAQMVQALLSGAIDATLPNVSEANQQLRDGTFRALAVMAEKRLEDYPDVPSTYELGYPVKTSTTRGYWVLKGTPRPVVERLSEALVKAMKHEVFANYLKIGAKIAGRPALDRRFKTIDFLVILDIRDLSPQSLQLYFSR